MIQLKKPIIVAVTMISCLFSFSSCKKDGNNKTVDADDPASSDPTLTLVWSDEFNGSSIDKTKWNFEVNGDGGGNGEAQYYTDSSTNAGIMDGKLVITARKESYKGKSYTSARMTTQYKAAFTYGRVEARIQLPTGRGMWPAFWMLSAKTPLQWPHDGEIDIMEAVGYRPDTVFSNIHCSFVGYGDLLPVPNYGSTYHVYATDWTADSLKFYVDNKLIVSYANAHLADATAAYNQWPFEHDFFIILNVAVGGAWGGINGIDDGIFPQRMSVDWVRVYQKK